MSPSSVPPQVPSSGRPLPFRRVPWAGSPTSPVLSADSDFSPPFAPRFVSFARHYHRFAPLRSPGTGTTPRGPGPLLPRRPRRLSSVEKTRPPRFLDNPCVHAPLSDPGGPPAPGHYRTGDGVFRTVHHVDSAMILISGLNHAACTLPVYASRPRSPQDAQHSVPAGGQPWPGRTLACGVAQKVSVMSIPLHGILLHQALPGAQTGQVQLTLVPRGRRCRRFAAVVAVALALLAASSFEPSPAASPRIGLILNEPEAFEGYTLFNRRRSKAVYLIDNLGRLVHQWNLSTPTVFAKLLENGNLLVSGFRQDKPKLQRRAGSGPGRQRRVGTTCMSASTTILSSCRTATCSCCPRRPGPWRRPSLPGPTRESQSGIGSGRPASSKSDRSGRPTARSSGSGPHGTIWSRTSIWASRTTASSRAILN